MALNVLLNPAVIQGAISAIQFISATLERYTNGELTEEQVNAEWAAIGQRLAATNAAWEAAGRVPPRT